MIKLNIQVPTVEGLYNWNIVTIVLEKYVFADMH